MGVTVKSVRIKVMLTNTKTLSFSKKLGISNKENLSSKSSFFIFLLNCKILTFVIYYHYKLKITLINLVNNCRFIFYYNYL